MCVDRWSDSSRLFLAKIHLSTLTPQRFWPSTVWPDIFCDNITTIFAPLTQGNLKILYQTDYGFSGVCFTKTIKDPLDPIRNVISDCQTCSGFMLSGASATLVWYLDIIMVYFTKTSREPDTYPLPPAFIPCKSPKTWVIHAICTLTYLVTPGIRIYYWFSLSICPFPNIFTPWS